MVTVMFLALVGIMGYVVDANETGIFDQYGDGCTCHPTLPATPEAQVEITGLPIQYVPDMVYVITVTVTGGPVPGIGGNNAEGGFNLNASAGTLAPMPGPPRVEVAGSQARHTAQGNDQRSWAIEWTAPPVGLGDVNFTVAAIAVDGDGSAVGDAWVVRTYIVPETGPVPPPTVDLTYPDGGEDLTGGSVHDIEYEPASAGFPKDQLLIWINYSLDGGVNILPIPDAQGIPGTFASPNVYAWTLPMENTMQARVNVEVKDLNGAMGSDTSAADFEIDSAPPMIEINEPVGTNVVPTADIRVGFDEGMNRIITEASFSLNDTVTWTPVAGAFGWAMNVMVFTPGASLQVGTEYNVNVTYGAMDDSDPGNNMAALFDWTFTIASGGDLEPPTISDVTAVPSPQEYPGNVNISAIVQDNVAVDSVWVNVTYPGGGFFEDFMVYEASSGRYFINRSYPELGVYDFTMYANDTNTVKNSSAGHTLEVVDTTPPTIAHTPVSLALADDPINITATVTDEFALALTDPVMLNYTNVTGSPDNITMMSAGGDLFYAEIPAQVIEGNVTYFVWATDEQGNEVMTAIFKIQIVTTDVFAPQILNAQALPSPQERYGDVNITVTVRDLSGLLSVWVVVTQSGTEIYTTNMTEGLNDLYHMEDQYSIVGTHDFTVWAEDNNNVVNSSSDTFEIVDTTPPAKPTGLSVASGDAGTLDIAWDANTELDLAGYDLYRSDTGANLTFTKVNTARITGTSYTDDGLEDNTTYYYMLKAVDDEGLESEYSDPASGTTITPGAEEEVDYMWLYALLAILIILVIVLAVASAMRKRPPAEEEEELKELDEVGEEYTSEEGEEAAEEETEKVY